VPSIISHAVVAVASGISFAPRDVPYHFWALSLICSVIPDAYILAFSFGIPYYHLFGHRGFFHSPFFGLLMGIFIISVFFRGIEFFSRQWFFYFTFSFLLFASHGILDAFTNGGLGISLLAPFDNTRYFFSWRPIAVSPIGVASFLSRWGLVVIKSEIYGYGSLPS
jgi:inner membrane protein